MKKENADAWIYTLEPEDVKELKEFEGRDLSELRPSIVVIKAHKRFNQDIQVFSELRRSLYPELAYPVSNTILFESFESPEGIIDLVLKRLHNGDFHWQELLNKYDQWKSNQNNK